MRNLIRTIDVWALNRIAKLYESWGGEWCEIAESTRSFIRTKYGAGSVK